MRGNRLALVTAFAGVALLSWEVLAQEAAAPQTTEDAWFVYSMEGKACGYLHMAKKVSGEEAASVLFVHDLAINEMGNRYLLHMQTFCKDDAYFSPVRMLYKLEGTEAYNIEATIERPAEGPSAGKLKTTGDRKVEMDIPEHTVVDFALFEIVRALPFDKDKVFEFNWVNAIDLGHPYVRRDQKVAYVGREELEIGGEKHTLHKFEQKGQVIRSIYCWVRDDRQLVRILWDGREEFVLSTKEKALAALKAE